MCGEFVSSKPGKTSKFYITGRGRKFPEEFVRHGYKNQKRTISEKINHLMRSNIKVSGLVFSVSIAPSLLCLSTCI
jgi:hypothetical protein